MITSVFEELILMMGCCLFVYYRVSVKNQNRFDKSLRYRRRPEGGHVSGFVFCVHVSIFIKYKFEICLFHWVCSLSTSSTFGETISGGSLSEWVELDLPPT